MEFHHFLNQYRHLKILDVLLCHSQFTNNFGNLRFSVYFVTNLAKP